MILDWNDLPNESVLEADVVIIGSGPAGIALANELTSTRLQTIVVESGGLKMEPEAQELNDADTIGLLHRERTEGRARALGGTAKLWYGQCLPLDEIDFTSRPWVPYSGWPFSRSDLQPYYKRAESFFRVDGEAYDESVYEPFKIGAPAWLPSKLASMATAYTSEVDTGEAWKSRIEAAANLRLLLHATVTNIVANESCSAFSHLQVQTISGRKGRVKAKAAVLCTGGLENARLLLVSRSQQAEGLGNAKGIVGRFFQEHPNGYTADVVADPKTVDTLQQTFRLLYGRNDVRHFPKFRLAEETQKSAEVLNCNASLLFEYPEESGIAALQEIYRAARRAQLPRNVAARLAAVVRDSPQVARSIWMRATSGQSPIGKPSRIRLQCYLEQAPTPQSRIVLSDRTDRFGLPLLAVDWQMTDLDIKSLQVLTATVKTEFSRLKLGEVTPLEWLSDNNWREHLVDCAHHSGTTRIGAHPACGVVDSDCKVFGIDGVYCAGSSVFPTSGYANPTLTIVAMAIRLADTLKLALGRPS